jgi:hypothetical protein
MMKTLAAVLLLFAVATSRVRCKVSRSSYAASHVSSSLSNKNIFSAVIKDKWRKARVLAELEQLVEG